MTSAIKIHCALEGLENNFLTFTPKWTQREVRDIDQAVLSDLFSIWLPRKVVSCYIEREGQPPITDPKDISWDAIADCDQQLYGFLVGAHVSAITQWHRAPRDHVSELSMPLAWYDAWLLEKFPGRTLEELDGMDLVRLMRAMHVERIAQVEYKRSGVMQNLIPQSQLTQLDWEQIAAHNLLVDEEP